MSDYDHQNYWKLANTRQQPIKLNGEHYKPELTVKSENGGEINVCTQAGYYVLLHKNRLTGWKKMFKIPYSVFRYIQQMNLPPERYVV